MTQSSVSSDNQNTENNNMEGNKNEREEILGDNDNRPQTKI
jgi:hypothetical protein